MQLPSLQLPEMSAAAASHDSRNNGIASASRSDFVRFCIDEEKLRGNTTLRCLTRSRSLNRNLPVSKSLSTAASTFFAFSTASEVEREVEVLFIGEEIGPACACFSHRVLFVSFFRKAGGDGRDGDNGCDVDFS